MPVSCDLQLNDAGEDVRALQRVLNLKGFRVTTEGPGAPGQETTTFGPATFSALVKFQSANNLPASGFFGPITRTFIDGAAASVDQ